MTKQIVKFLFLFTGIMFLTFTASAGKRYWRGTGANKNWNNTANWSLTSGGTTGAAVPGSTDSVYFNSGGDSICSINANASVKMFSVDSSYHKTITQTTFTLTVGTGGMTMNGGTFSGGSAAMSTTSFSLNGTSFTSTSGSFTIGANYTYSSGSFFHNNGKVIFNGNATLTSTPDTTNFYKLQFLNATFTIHATSVFNVLNELIHTGGGQTQINGGTINVQGDITQTNNYVTGGGTGTININGTGPQFFNGQTSAHAGLGWLCNIKINKPSDTLFVKDYAVIQGNWEHVAGNVNYTRYNSTINFPAFINSIINGFKGRQTINNLLIGTYGGISNMIAVNSGDTLTIAGTYIPSGNGATGFSGVICLTGDINQAGTNNSTSATGGTGTLIINGIGTQTITGSTTLGADRLCTIKINKPSGTLILKNYVNMAGDWIYQNGTLDDTASTVVFCTSGGRTISGKPSLYNVCFYAPLACTNTIADTLKVRGTLTTEGSSVITLNTGVIETRGNVTINNTANVSTATGGTATLLFWKGGNQTINGSSTIGVGKLCNVKIDKPSGDTLILRNIVNVGGDWIYQNGSGNIKAGTSTVCFGYSTGRTISGSQTLYNVHFSAPSTCTNTISSTDTITVLGELKTSGTFPYLINSGTINAKGHITLTNIASAAGGGSGWINICGTGDQTLTGSGTAIGGCLCNTKINKNTGTLYLSSIISLHSGSVWRYVKGIVNGGTSSFYAIAGADIDCDNGSSYMKFNNFGISGGSTATLSGVLRVSGDFFIQAARTLNTNSYNVEVGGNWDVSGTFTFGTSKLTLNGSGNQYLTHPTGSTGFYDLEINKPSGKFYFQASQISVSHAMTLIKGIIVSSSSHIFSMPDNATSTAGNDSSYVSGPFKKIGNDAFTFPLGDTLLSSGAYHPLSITAPGSTTDAFTAQYYSVNQSVGSTKVDSIDLSTCEYWTIARNVGSSNIKTTLGWNTNNCHTTNAYDMVVSGWDGTNSIWKSLENTNITIAGSKGTVTAAVTPYWSGTSAVNIMIAKKKAINITELVHDPYCFPGATRGFAHIGVTYGAPPYTYAWSNSATTQDIDSLTAGTYSLTITDRYSRTFTRNYTLQNCVSWSTLPSGLSSDTTGQLHKSTGDTTWIAAQSVLIIDTIQTGRWIKFTIADTTTKFLLGFGPVAIDSVEEEANLMMFMEGSILTVIETDNDGFYSKEVIGSVAVNDELKIEMDESRGILYYKNNVLIYMGKLLSNSRMQLTANIYGSSKNIKKIRCSSNN